VSKEHNESALKILAEIFAESEPLFTMMKIPKEAAIKMVTLMWPCCVSSGLSVVAIDDASQRVAGAFTGVDEAVMES
jgi:hypothetical protein